MIRTKCSHFLQISNELFHCSTTHEQNQNRLPESRNDPDARNGKHTARRDVRELVDGQQAGIWQLRNKLFQSKQITNEVWYTAAPAILHNGISAV